MSKADFLSGGTTDTWGRLLVYLRGGQVMLA